MLSCCYSTLLRVSLLEEDYNIFHVSSFAYSIAVRSNSRYLYLGIFHCSCCFSTTNKLGNKNKLIKIIIDKFAWTFCLILIIFYNSIFLLFLLQWVSLSEEDYIFMYFTECYVFHVSLFSYMFYYSSLKLEIFLFLEFLAVCYF